MAKPSNLSGLSGMGRDHQSMQGAGENHAKELRSMATAPATRAAPTAAPPVKGTKFGSKGKGGKAGC